MSTQPPYPQQPQPQQPYPQQQPYPGQQYPGQQYPQQYPDGPPPKRRPALPWLVGGAVVVIAAVVVTLVLVLGGDDDGAGTGGGTGSGTASGGTGYDLSTPEKAAESIAAAAKAGDVQEFLKLTCVGTPGCIAEHGKEASQEDVAAFREKIERGLGEFAKQLEGAEFGEAKKTSQPGLWEVSYKTPNMSGDEFRALTFVEVDGKWLWVGSSGGGSGGGSGNSGGGGSAPSKTRSCPPTPSVTGPLPQHPAPGC